MHRYSELFGKTTKSTSAKQYASKNAQLLTQAGYIYQVMSGVYTLLPLGLRVVKNIEKIVREEMDKIGVELLLPALAPKEVWQKTGRYQTLDVLLKAIPANKVSENENSVEYVLNPTHEDILTEMAKKYVVSYKDLPFAVYQIQTKFRNEPRAKSGLLRTREFIMKDLYSFHTSKEDLMKYYEKAKQAYWNVYTRLGLKEYTFLTAASGGDFTDNYSHEFQIKCENGEDTVFYAKTAGEAFNKEVAPSKAPKIEEGEDNLKPLELKETPNITTVKKLAKFLNVPVYKTVKTLIYNCDNSFIAVALRGDYEVNEIKLKKVLKCKNLRLATNEEIEKLTTAKTGYAGLINLPENVKIIADESIQNLVNFELGGNKTNYHYINVNWERDLPKPKEFFDIKIAKEGDLHPKTGEVYEVFKASEAGNIFPLETKFTKLLNYYYFDKEGNKKLVYMGSYGIGITRLMGIMAEVFNDNKGLAWPKQVAPFKVHFITLDESLHKQAEEIIKSLESKGIDVLWDDRTDVRAGEKFKDYELIGIPYRVVLSKNSLEKGGVELKERIKEEVKFVNPKDLVNIL
ncbi:MAG TPA: proline--tRNA ligase [candidate division WWE3 bacterium]|uniref:Proline--tRNA ligase n=1 Tax=candidate division WWE3 bacterium TaxID=2053526 RepID=A0A7V5MI15_UNCKA|nr:proline--tRNA ligase [candidate division WWE3 bacterium]